jgi:hypothetical protein
LRWAIQGTLRCRSLRLLQVVGVLALLAAIGLLLLSTNIAVVVTFALIGVVLLVLGTFGDRMEGKQRLNFKFGGQDLTMELNLAKAKRLALKADRELEAGEVIGLQEVEKTNYDAN